ncbi:MAG: ATP-dependent zinc metalloprotease FtsH [Dehalococcoidia bacterium]
MSSRWMRNSLVYLLIVVAVITVFFMFFNEPLGGAEEINLTEVIEMARNNPGPGRIEIEVSGEDLTVRDGSTVYRSRKEVGSSIVELMMNAGVEPDNYTVEAHGSGGLGNIFGVLIGFLPLILFGGILLFMMRQAQGSNNQTMSFGRSKARMFVGTKATVTFFDVAGVPEAKQELEEVVEFLKYPERFQALGARIPRGVLLVGPPGTGKTLLARAVAGEAGVPFFSISGSEFVEMFVGVGASRVRDLFEQAKRHSPCIVFIDEIDAVGRHRGAGLGGGHDEREQTLNQILVEMDGFDTSTNVIVIAATNRPDILDPALLRPGRFDRRVILDNPDIRGRTAILDVHAKGKPIDKDVDMANVARQTPGFSGADLANLINEAALLAARRNRKSIGFDELTEAIDRVMSGPARKSRVISQRERELTAYHEAGHALVAYHMPGADMVWKISIVSRGQMGGYTRYLPDEDRYLQTLKQFKAMIATAMGGRGAEVTKFGEVTTGASNDIEVATRIARQMVTRYGMSEKLGMRTFGKRQEAIFLGKEMSEERDYSLRTEEVIDNEVNDLLEEGRENAEKILKEHAGQLDKLSMFLLEHETIDGDQMKALLEGADPDSLVRRSPEPAGPENPPDARHGEQEQPAAERPEPEPQAT